MIYILEDLMLNEVPEIHGKQVPLSRPAGDTVLLSMNRWTGDEYLFVGKFSLYATEEGGMFIDVSGEGILLHTTLGRVSVEEGLYAITKRESE